MLTGRAQNCGRENGPGRAEILPGRAVEFRPVQTSSLHVCVWVCLSGAVKVWDPRQKNDPVAVMEPAEGDDRRDCWAVAFGKYHFMHF